MSLTKYLYLVTYKVPYQHRNDWYIEGITLYAKDQSELEETIRTLPAHNDPTKTLLQVEQMQHGLTIMHSWLPSTIEVEGEMA